MVDQITDCVICERKAECFKMLSDDDLKYITSNKNTVHYKRGETIIKQGTEFTHIISFNAGLAKLNVEVNHDKNVVVSILKPSEILGGPGMFVNNRYSFTVTALTDSTICLINVDVFKEMIQSNLKFAESFLVAFSSRYTEAISRLVSISHKHMNGRVAEALLYLSDRIFVSNDFELPLSRQELADYTGTSKESISRIFKDFSDDKIIEVDGRMLRILDKEKLYQIESKG